MNEIIPAILPGSFDDLSVVEQFTGVTRWVQLDICDGLFVSSRTWPLFPKDRARFARMVKGEEGLPHWQDFDFEVDLMMHHPERCIPAWLSAGAGRFVVHLESHHSWEAVRDAAGAGIEVGIAIDLDPPYEHFVATAFRADYIQIMGIAELGKQGSTLDERALPLIERVRSDFPDVTIQIDGGVTLENARSLFNAGADRLVVGSKIVRAPSPKEVLIAFQNL